VHQAHPVVTVCLGNDYSVLFDPHGVVFNIKVDPTAHRSTSNVILGTGPSQYQQSTLAVHTEATERSNSQTFIRTTPHPQLLATLFQHSASIEHTPDSSQSPQVGHTPPCEGAETQTPQRPRSGRLGTRHASWSTRVLSTRDLLSLANSNNGKGRVRYTIAQYQLHCMVTGQWGRG